MLKTLSNPKFIKISLCVVSILDLSIALLFLLIALIFPNGFMGVGGNYSTSEIWMLKATSLLFAFYVMVCFLNIKTSYLTAILLFGKVFMYLWVTFNVIISITPSLMRYPIAEDPIYFLLILASSLSIFVLPLVLYTAFNTFIIFSNYKNTKTTYEV